MPGCAAIGCNNRSEKGHRMKSFPRDPKLRKIWQERVGRANWEPSNNSFLCHEHFESDKWCIMENGRVKLQKDALPSIFNITSTRKSIKKRREVTGDNNENNRDIENSMMHVKNNSDSSSIDHLEEKYSDSKDVHNPSVQLSARQTNNFSETVENKQTFIQHCDPQQENILISDGNIKRKGIIRTYPVKKRADEENKSVSDFVPNVANNSSEDLTKPELREDVQVSVQSYDYDEIEENIKTELKEEVQVSVRPYNYDEIEEKLKQICDGYFEEDTNNMEKSHIISDNPKEVLQRTPNKAPVHRSISYKHSSGNNIGHMLTNDDENIEIIFSAENGEDTCLHKRAAHHNDIADETELLDRRSADTSNVRSNKEIEQNINVTPNMMAAMKRKRRTRDEIMKSIEKSIRNASFQNITSLNDSDTFDDNVEVGNQRKKIQKTQDDSSSDTSPTTTRFTVKVTGHPDDVSDIMHNLSRNTGDTSLQEYSDALSSKEDDGFVTSVITIDDCPIDDCPVDVDDIKVEFEDDDSLSSSIRNVTDYDRMLPSTSRNCQYLDAEVTPYFDEELDDLNITNNRLISVNATQLSTNECDLKRKYEELQRKLSMQANVVKELSNQLIFCKRAEHGLQSKNSTLEKKIQSLTDQLNALSSVLSSTEKDGNLSQKKLIDDLTSKLIHFDEANKKLVKSASAAAEQMKKLENQIKQKDSRIKEFNWKLDKASKYLERAEKNTNTYRKKMLNLQSFLKRKKLLDEKMIKFNQILTDIVKKNYANKILPMSVAMKIKKTCGTTEYDKLLQSGFPLPTLTAVRIASDNLLDFTKNTNEISRATTSRRNVNEVYDAQFAENHVEEADSENVELADEEVMLDDTETVMGTVQDIFDESSDDDDFSTNELTEDFILQLHKLM